MDEPRRLLNARLREGTRGVQPNGARVQYDASSDDRWDRTPPEGAKKSQKPGFFDSLFALCRAHEKTSPFFHELSANIINTLHKIVIYLFGLIEFSHGLDRLCNILIARIVPQKTGLPG